MFASLTAPSAQAAPTGISITNVVINKGKPIVVGTSDVQEPPATWNISLPPGYTPDGGRFQAHPFLYRNTTPAKAEFDTALRMGTSICYATGPRSARCEGTLYIEPRYDLRTNSDATTWKIGLAMRLFNPNGTRKAEEHRTASGGVQVKRWGKATVDASPEPVKKGKKLTVTGKLTRADWAKRKYTGVAGSATLQFRKKGSSAYTSVKTVQSDSAGALKTTVTASVDGHWRWTYKGSSTTGPATSATDFVDVR